MKVTIPTFLILSFASVVLADDFKTIDGKEYENVTVNRVEPDGIVLTSSFGISKVYFTELPKEVQEHFRYDQAKSAAYSAEQNANLERLRKQQEESLRQKAEVTAKNNKYLGEQQTASEAAKNQRDNVQALQARYKELQQQEDDLRKRIGEADQLPGYLYGRSGSRSYSVRNPARQNIPDWQSHLNDVRHEKDQVRRQLEQAQR